jgi:hypothetical protein
MKLLATLFAAAAATAASASNYTEPVPVNGCVTFTVSAGTGCAWMCNYCANTLGTNNYYFTTDVCTYKQGAGCVGNPLAGVPYTCCAAEEAEEDVLEAEDVDVDCEAAADDDDEDSFSSDDAEPADDFDTEIWIIKIRSRSSRE